MSKCLIFPLQSHNGMEKQRKTINDAEITSIKCRLSVASFRLYSDYPEDKDGRFLRNLKSKKVKAHILVKALD